MSYQEEHPLLKAFPRELAEAAEPDEFLRVKHKHTVTNQILQVSQSLLQTASNCKESNPAGDDEVLDAGQIFLQL